MAVSNTKASGSIFDKEEKFKDTNVQANAGNVYIPQFVRNILYIIIPTIDNRTETTVNTFDDMMSGWFKFVQTEDGSVPAVIHPNAEDSDALNFKKSIVSAFQANFKGTKKKVEADPQSTHVAEYT